MTAPGFSCTTGICGTTSIVTQPDSSSAATSPLPATSSRVLNPWVMLPTLQLAWSSATVLNVRSAAFIQNTQPAGTRPVRPSSSASGIGSSKGATPSGGAVGEGDREGSGAEVQGGGELGREVGPVSGGHGRQLTHAGRGAVPRRRGTRSTNASTSASVDDQPTLARSERSASTPIAASTGDGSSVSLEHDEPECTATPCWSRREEDRLGLDAADPEAHEVGERRRGIAVALDVGDRGERRGRRGRSVSARARAASRAMPPSVELGRGRAEADDAGDVLDAAAARALLRAADDERREPQPAAHQQRADALGAAELVRGDRAEVGAEADELEVDVAGGRARVDVHDDAALARLLDDGRGRLERADLVVGELDRDERGVGADRADHLVGVEAPGAVDADLGDREPVGAPAGVEHRRVLDGGGDDVTVSPARASAPQIAVLTASVPLDVNTTSRGRAPNSAATCSRAVSTATRVDAAFGVQATGIAVVVAEVRQHRVERARAQRRRRRVIEIRARHGACRRQTRATQWSSPSGRLVSNCGDVSP